MSPELVYHLELVAELEEIAARLRQVNKEIREALLKK